ncbi:MAG: DUF6125 family protein [Syntrophales bacterium]|jgi:hypothetical protein|nr:DUF6125 family protein [Syntrophales bacterium]MDX9923094.1 DUF6125 family protein [Syntrophales bacterium]
MKSAIEKPDDLDQKDTALLFLDLIHRLMVHYTFWFRGVEYHLGMGKALDIMETAWGSAYQKQIERMSRILNFDVENGIPRVLLTIPDDIMRGMLQSIGISWIANSGVWFDSIEETTGMLDAKKCNDSMWERFSPFEAWSIKRFLGLEEFPGLEGLKKALRFRLYAFINEENIIDEAPGKIIFQTNKCFIQMTRKKKDLQEYPCKSAGFVEFGTFAETIDSRIKTECITCPPDPHPDGWYCSWSFTIPDVGGRT